MVAEPHQDGRIRKPRWLYAVAVLLGAFGLLFGVVLIAGYVSSAVVARIGEPDQSLVFWYLPFLLAGIIAVASGLAVAVWGIVGLRRIG